MTVILAGSTAVFAWGLSIPIGIYSAVRQHSVEDYTVTFVGFMGLAVPDFLLALWLLWITFTYFPGISIGGPFSPEYLEAPWSFGRLVDLLSHLWIAMFVVGTAARHHSSGA
jgi:peptide/nickel transport system permease protein